MGKDLGSWIDWHGEPQYIKRDHRVTQEDFISVYCERLKKEVRDWRYVESIEHERQILEEQDTAWHNELVRTGYLRARKRYPWTHHSRHHWGHYSPGAPLRDRRAAADPLHSQFIRPARGLRNLPDAWDDKWNRCSTGWKQSTKYRHQWEAKANRLYKKALKARL